jgi:hypothetical protein
MQRRITWAVIIPFALAGTLAAQTKTSGTISCGKPDPAYSIEVNDRPGHTISLEKFACTWTKPMEIEGVQTKDGVDVATDDGSGAKFRGSGYHMSNMANGDKIYVRFSGTDTMTKEGKPAGNQGTWRYTGGTGKFKGITGKGIYKGKADADGNMVTEVEGVYTLPAKK